MSKTFRTTTVTRRSLLAGASLALAAALSARYAGAPHAQESTPTAIGTPAPGISTIRPTTTGDVPSTGASRPGPANMVTSPVVTDIVAPIGLAVVSAGIDAGIENLRVVDGAMQDPSGPWVVAWYENLGSLGDVANVVMAGHIDYWNVGPSVFYNLGNVQEGDAISVSGDDGLVYPYAVDWVRQFDSNAMPLDEVTGSTGERSLTLITCGGAFDFANGQYLQRTVVRAHQTGPAHTLTA